MAQAHRRIIPDRGISVKWRFLFLYAGAKVGSGETDRSGSQRIAADRSAGGLAQSEIADHQIDCRFDFQSVFHAKAADRIAESGIVDAENFIGRQDQRTVTGNIDQWIHYLDRLYVGAERNDDRSPRPAGNVVVLHNHGMSFLLLPGLG